MNPLVQPDPGLYIWTILTYLSLLAVLAKFAWRPLLTALLLAQQAWRRRGSYDFAGRSVVITGGSRGLGLIMARELADEGARRNEPWSDFTKSEKSDQVSMTGSNWGGASPRSA